MSRRSTDGPLYPIVPEIERLFRQRRRTQLRAMDLPPMQNPVVPNARANQHAATHRPRVIRNHLNPILDDLNPSIVSPEIKATHFELKPVMLNMLNPIGQFGVMPHEDARQHIRSFLEVYDSFRQQVVHEDC